MTLKKLIPYAIGAAAIFWLLSRKQTSLHGLSGFGEVASSDVESDEDLARAAANLVALESHIESSAAASGDEKYLDALNTCRELRRKEMARLIPENAEGESWCMLKHLLGASIQLCETAAKKLAEGDKAAALSLLQDGKKARSAAILFAKRSRPGAQCAVCKGG